MGKVLISLIVLLSAGTSAQQVIWPDVCSESECPRIPGAINHTSNTGSPVWVNYVYATFMSNIPTLPEYLNNTCFTQTVKITGTNSSMTTFYAVDEITNTTSNTTTTDPNNAVLYASNPSDFIILNPDGSANFTVFGRIIISNPDYFVSYTCVDISSNCYQIWSVAGQAANIPPDAPWLPQLKALGASVTANDIYNYSPSCYT